MNRGTGKNLELNDSMGNFYKFSTAMFDYRKVLNGHMASELVDGLNIFTTHSSLERGYFLEWVETTNWLSILGIWRQCVGSWDIMGLVRSMTETCVGRLDTVVYF